YSFLSSSLLLYSYIHSPPHDIFTLSLHDALPIYPLISTGSGLVACVKTTRLDDVKRLSKHSDICPVYTPHAMNVRVIPKVPVILLPPDRKSTRLNSSHVKISYAVFCLKKKTIMQKKDTYQIE